MQGIVDFIPTENKIDYINAILEVGFDTVDFGSFVSPKAIPQLRDTREVLAGLTTRTRSKLLAIVANLRGAEEALQYDRIDFLGFPLSLSETFQKRNTNKSIDQAFKEVKSIQDVIVNADKKLVVYLSMGFGNPYGDPYDETYIEDFVKRLVEIDVKIISLSDTIGIATASTVNRVLAQLINNFPDLEIGAHLHVTPDTAEEKVNAIISAGCMRIDGAIGGFGGCPMAKDELTGNLNTMILLKNDAIPSNQLNVTALAKAHKISSEIFSQYH